MFGFTQQIKDTEEEEEEEEETEEEEPTLLSSICYRPHLLSKPTTPSILHNLVFRDLQEKKNEHTEPPVNRGTKINV